MERGIGRFLFTSCTLTFLVGLCVVSTAQLTLLEEHCRTCVNCRTKCGALSGKRSALSDRLNSWGNNVFQASPQKRKVDNNRCSMIQMYNLLPTECSETMDWLVEWAQRGLLDNE